MILMIDNYDSFTFNVVQYLLELGADTRIRTRTNSTALEIAERPKLRPLVLAVGERHKQVVPRLALHVCMVGAHPRRAGGVAFQLAGESRPGCVER